MYCRSLLVLETDIGPDPGWGLAPQAPARPGQVMPRWRRPGVPEPPLEAPGGGDRGGRRGWRGGGAAAVVAPGAPLRLSPGSGGKQKAASAGSVRECVPCGAPQPLWLLSCDRLIAVCCCPATFTESFICLLPWSIIYH